MWVGVGGWVGVGVGGWGGVGGCGWVGGGVGGGYSTDSGPLNGLSQSEIKVVLHFFVWGVGLTERVWRVFWFWWLVLRSAIVFGVVVYRERKRERERERERER